MKKMVVTAPVAAVYENEEGTALLSDELLCGMTAQPLQQYSGGILRIRSFYGYEGYAKASAFKELTEEWEAAPKLVVIGSYVNVQSQPAVRSLVVLSLPRGALVCGDGPSLEGWQPVHMAGGEQGFIQSVHLGTYPMGEAFAVGELRRSLCQNALSYLGCCYRWGGKTPLGIDCSGLCSQVYLNHGIAIYRDARIMEGYPVREIPQEQLEPADLLYWKGHIALYLGEGRYIHSTASSGGVTVNSLIKGQVDYREDLAKSLLCCGTAL
ncbi:MAG: C40 family peptidase [Angelakisella sp.]